MKKWWACAVALLLAAAPLCVSAKEDADSSVPYDSYAYNLQSEPVSIPAPYVPERVYVGGDFGLEPMKDIADIYYDAESGSVYICDSGNDRIVVLDAAFKMRAVLDGFDNGGVREGFSEPSSVFVRGGRLYVCDTGNARIVCLDEKDHTLLRVFPRPAIALLEADYLYAPSKLVVDPAGRMYVTARGINHGLLQLDETGAFIGFMGAPDVHLDFWDILWRSVATQEQRENMAQAVPTEHTSIAVDDKGFIFATSMSEGVAPISKLNGQGENVVHFLDETPSGDGVYIDAQGEKTSSKFVDIAVRDDGVYLALDSTRSRLFAYDGNGTMLYAFGGAGTQQGTTYSPSAVEIVENRVAVADKTNGSVTLYRRTAFGEQVDEALHAYSRGETGLSREKWETVLQRAPQYTVGQLLYARLVLQEGDPQTALPLLKRIGAREYASQAYRELRSGYIRQHFYWLLPLALGALIGLIVLLVKGRRLAVVRRVGNIPLVKQVQYAGYAMVHPFDGFWDIKREGRGSLPGALIWYGLFFLLYAVRVQFTSYLFSDREAGAPSLLPELLKIALPLLLWCLSNWCFTTLMDGKGTIKDIAVATGYALAPYVCMSLPLLALSHVLTLEEAVIYHTLDGITIVWVLALLVFSTMMTHDYSFGKTLLTVCLIVVGILLILFIALLFLNIVQQVVTYGQDIYQEIAFRMY